MRKLSTARKETRRARARAAPRDVPSLPPEDAKRKGAARRPAKGAHELLAAGYWYEAGYWWNDAGDTVDPNTPEVQPKKTSANAAAKVPVRTYEAVARVASGGPTEVHAGGVTVNIPSLKTVSEQNLREHWRSRSARTKHQKEVVTLALNTALAAIQDLQFPLVVVLTRVSPGMGLDTDNMVSSQKHVRDAVAEVLGIDDRDTMVEWKVQQRKGAWAVDIHIAEA